MSRSAFMLLAVHAVPGINLFNYSTWKIAPENVLLNSYLPYEYCILQNAKNGIFDNNKDVHHQPQCKHLIDPWFNSLPQRCWLGSRQQRIDDGICLKPRLSANCRSLREREGFYKYWSHLERSQLDKNSNAAFASELAAIVKQAGFNTLGFGGDSMAIQLSQRFACEFLRKNVTLELYGNFFSMFDGAAALIKRSNSINGIDNL